MRIARTFIFLALGAMASTLPVKAQAGRDLASVLIAIDQTFICPEFQPDDAARRAEVASFSRALASVGPTRITYRKAVYIRARMLERHHCGRDATTVASVDTTGPTAAGAAN